MLTKIWTGTLLFLAWLSFCAWLVLVCREKNVHPLRDFALFFKKQTKAGRIIFGTFFIAMWIFASVKPGGDGNGGGDGGGDGGTNNVPQMVCPPGGSTQMSLPGGMLQQQTGLVGQHSGLQPVQPLNGGATLNLSGFTPITSTNTLRMITADDFERGFVQTRIGTDEEFDFSPLANATIVSDWRAFGAATDWIYAAFTNWTFKVATNDVSRLRIYSFGKVEPLIREMSGAIATNNWFAPFIASLGIVPEANWNWLTESDRPSRVWYAITPWNSLLITCQNALLDRDTDKPLSFQIEFKTDGQFIYRYDLSRLDVDSVSNILAGASFAGNIWATNSLPTNVTSMAFYPLTEADAYDQDPDNDGLLTIDELFFYNTDPHNADTDYDGLNDGEELLVYSSDPLDPNSISETYCDGFAAKLGDLDPFSCPEGSTNTIYEHIIYTGTTNAPFAYPVDTNDTAVLTITVSGSGAGRIVIGDIVVPVMARPAPPPLRGSGGDAPDPTANSVRVPLPRGVEFGFWGSIPETLQMEIDAGSYTIGRIPAWYTLEHGWIAFPNTKAKEPCIHDLNAKKLLVYLDPGRDIKGLVCTWSPTASISVEAKSDLSAELTGSFPRSSTTPVTYTLTHSCYLYGPTQYTQTARFCPRLSENEDNGLHGDGMPTDEEYGDEHSCSCGSGVCCGNPWCDCGCACCEPGGGETPANICAEHNCPYDQCEDLHHDAYTNTIAIASMVDVLKLDRNPVYTNTIPIDVPDAWVKCCDCPDHWTNYVALAAKSYNLAVRTASGERFERTVDDCSIYVHGLAPSRDFKDSILSLCKTGVVYETHSYTVLGLDIGHPRYDVHEVAKWNSNFGFPVVATTNVNLGTVMYLRTDVDLPSGEINIKFDNPTVRFQLYLGGEYDDRTLLLDSAVHEDGRTLPLNVWKRLTEDFTSGRNTQITVVAFGGGTTTLRYSFAAIHDSRSVTDTRELRLSAILPLLVPDVDGNGMFNDDDARHCVSNRFNFWVNNDIWTGNDAFDDTFWDWIDGLGNDDNGDDNEVNGRNDLVNLLPMAIRVQDFLSAWSSHEVKIVIRGRYSGIRRLYADIAWNDARASVLRDIEVDDESSWYNFWSGTTLHSASFPSLGESERPLADNVASRSQSARGVVLFEAEWECECPIEVAVKVDGNEVFACRPDLAFLDVKKMYWWHNLRHLFGGQGKIDPSDTNMTSVAQLPLSAFRQDANFYFVHGYNMAQHEAREWAQAIYKRLWWSGFRGRFHAVTWYSNDSQLKLPAVGYVCPNYHANVEHAFASASNLTAVVANYSGSNYFMAHSLGNMLVSAAIQDWQMPCERYFMLNAAVAAEAYDTSSISSSTRDCITPSDWDAIQDRLRASHWFETDGLAADDDRRSLTWRDRFTSVANVVNYYSTQDEVLMCDTNGVSHHPIQRKWAWYNQERIKGVKPFEQFVGLDLGINEGGWSFNPHYNVPYQEWDPDTGMYVTRYRPPTATEANALTNDFRVEPVFGKFSDTTLFTTNHLAPGTISYPLRAQLLADAIPAESFPAGYLSAPVFSGSISDYDMAIEFKDSTNISLMDSDNRSWCHSYFLQAPYMVVHELFENINQKIQ